MSGCTHDHQIRIINYDINDNVKSWFHCVDCNTDIEDVLPTNTQEVDRKRND